MVIRKRLTPEDVAATELPDRGETWIADTVVPGFGLRLWRSGKAYAVRVTDREGRVRRRTFVPHVRDQMLWHAGDRPVWDSGGRLRLELVLDTAREWARREIARAKGLAPSQEEEDRRNAEERARKAEVGAKLAARTLGNVADTFIEAGPGRGWSEEYTDRVRSLWYAHVPDDIASTTVSAIKAEDYQRLLTSVEMGDATAMALRNLLHQLHWWIHGEGGPVYGQISLSLSQIESKRPLLEAEAFARTVGADEVKQLFNALDRRESFHSAAMCIKMALATRTPVARCMKAEWAHVQAGYWYPWRPGERRLWDGYRHPVRGTLAEVFAEARKLWNGESPFIFPSSTSAIRPVRRVDHVWSGALRSLGWPYGRVTTYARQSSYLRWMDFRYPRLSNAPNQFTVND